MPHVERSAFVVLLYLEATTKTPNRCVLYFKEDSLLLLKNFFIFKISNTNFDRQQRWWTRMGGYIQEMSESCGQMEQYRLSIERRISLS
jgi:hypothetical protein